MQGPSIHICIICLEPITDGNTYIEPNQCDCIYGMHDICYRNFRASNIGTRCPTCRTPFSNEKRILPELTERFRLFDNSETTRNLDPLPLPPPESEIELTDLSGHTYTIPFNSRYVILIPLLGTCIIGNIVILAVIQLGGGSYDYEPLVTSIIWVLFLILIWLVWLLAFISCAELFFYLTCQQTLNVP